MVTKLALAQLKLSSLCQVTPWVLISSDRKCCRAKKEKVDDMPAVSLNYRKLFHLIIEIVSEVPSNYKKLFQKFISPTPFCN